MINKDILKQVLASNQKDIENYKIVPRTLPGDDFPCRVFVGVRRAGKSFMLYQKMQQTLASGQSWATMLYLNFEDDRLAQFDRSDFELILEAHAEMYAVWLTGSNAKMLSSEVMTTLGGRYLATEVYPYSFQELLKIQDIPYDKISQMATESRAKILRAWNEYLLWGGLPESVGLTVKRNYLSSTFQKIYLGDIASRNKIANPNLLRLMVKKLAENVGQPVSYNRLANVLSTISGRISMPTVSKYIEYSEAAWLLLRLRNVSAPFTEKETSCKYYFIDNGVLDLFLLDGETMLLENIVALALFHKYGHDADNERVFFYNDKVEVDFYIPEDATAIQVSYSITQSTSTYEREVNALKKIPGALSCKRRLILTNDESDSIEDQYGTIEVLPVWKWLLLQGRNE